MRNEQDRTHEPQPERPHRGTPLHDHRKRALGFELRLFALGDEASRFVIGWHVHGWHAARDALRV